MRAVAFALLILTIASPRAEPFLVVRVIEETTNRPLPNAEVIEVEAGRRRFTDDRGLAAVPWPASQRLHLRVRQLGFKFVEHTFQRSPDSAAADTVTIVLQRVAYALPEVVTREAPRCEQDTDSLAKQASVFALEQLRLGAERFEAFRKAYPFRIRQERRTVRVGEDGKAKSVRSNFEEANGDRWGDPYVPNDIVRREPLGFSIAILFVSTLADSTFWARHCFTVLGIESLDGQRAVRLHFAPATTIRDPEWQGTAFIDSATSILRRVEFRLTGLTDRHSPRRFEGYTTFSSPSPFVAIPDSTVGMWWQKGPRTPTDWGMPEVVQLLHVLELRYRQSRPP